MRKHLFETKPRKLNAPSSKELDLYLKIISRDLGDFISVIRSSKKLAHFNERVFDNDFVIFADLFKNWFTQTRQFYDFYDLNFDMPQSNRTVFFSNSTVESDIVSGFF